MHDPAKMVTDILRDWVHHNNIEEHVDDGLLGDAVAELEASGILSPALTDIVNHERQTEEDNTDYPPFVFRKFADQVRFEFPSIGGTEAVDMDSDTVRRFGRALIAYADHIDGV